LLTQLSFVESSSGILITQQVFADTAHFAESAHCAKSTIPKYNRHSFAYMLESAHFEYQA